MDSRNHNFGLQKCFFLFYNRGGGSEGDVKLFTFFFEGFPNTVSSLRYFQELNLRSLTNNIYPCSIAVGLLTLDNDNEIV